MPPDPYKYFRVEARELLEQLGKAALDLEKAGGGFEGVQRLLRSAHTLKGAARVVKQREIADESHAIEETLAPYRQAGDAVPSDAIDAILKLVDRIGAHVSALAPAEPTQAADPGRGPSEEALHVVRAEVAEVDALLDGLAETHVQLSSLRKITRELERARHLAELLVEQVAPRVNRDNLRPAASRSEKALSLAEDLRAIFPALQRNMGAAVDLMDRELRQVRDAAEHLRLVPAGTLFTSLERTARDTAQSAGKQVLFDGRGGDVRIDAHVLAAIQPALLQLIRNAVAHGIETATDRHASGKPPAGRVLVEIIRRGRRVVFRCQDDGRGVDLEAVRRTAAKRGLSTPQAGKLDSEELVRLLLRGGISTSAAVTEVAGRGVGLDVVREAVERLGGEVRVATESRRGTTFELHVPLSLASIQGLSVESSGILATLPLDAVKRTVRVTSAELSRTAQGDALVFEGKVIPFVSLPSALRTDSPSPARSAHTTSAVVVEAGGRLAALGVDRLLGTATVVLRPLPDLAPADAIVAGASLDAEGNPQIVLDPDGIVQAAAHATSPASDVEPARPSVLVIDDSLTTRMLEQSILESAGFEVDLATSGEQAIDLAHKKQYALFLVDVEMPGMDGFTFIERARAEPRLRDTPAILVTSRASAEDRERGTRVGAQGYIAKSEFDQSDLLARIRRLVG